MTTLLNTVSDTDLLDVIKLLRATNALMSLSKLVENNSGMNQIYLLSFSMNHPSIFSGYLENAVVYDEDLHKGEHIAFGENFKHKLLIAHFIPRLRLVSMNEEIQTYSPRQLEAEMIKRGLNKLAQLEALMSRHNWQYMYSEDAGQYQRGMETEQQIGRLSEELRRIGNSSEVVKLWERYAK